MKKKIAEALFCAVFLILMLPGTPASAEEKLSFLSINDTLPPELINCVSYYNGIAYVPYYTFTNTSYGLSKPSYGISISYSYFTSASTAYLSTKDKQLFFELKSGETYDGDDNHYSAPAILQSGTVYLPLSLMQRFFGGFSYSYIEGNEYGSILRITTDAVVLTDAEFLRAARNTMRSYYQSYNTETAPVSTPAPPAPTPVPTPETHEGERMTLAFAGLPSERMLTALAQNRIKTCFFLTAEDVRSDPDLVRRIAGEGHALGVYCPGDLARDYAETSALLFEAARVRTILVTSAGEDEEDRAAAEAAGLVWFESGFRTAEAENGGSQVYGAAAAWLDTDPEDLSLLLGRDTGGAWDLGQLLGSLTAQKYDVVSPRETD